MYLYFTSVIENCSFIFNGQLKLYWVLLQSYFFVVRQIAVTLKPRQ